MYFPYGRVAVLYLFKSPLNSHRRGCTWFSWLMKYEPICPESYWHQNALQSALQCHFSFMYWLYWFLLVPYASPLAIYSDLWWKLYLVKQHWQWKIHLRIHQFWLETRKIHQLLWWISIGNLQPVSPTDCTFNPLIGFAAPQIGLVNRP